MATLKEQRIDAIASARKIASRASEEGRDLTPTEAQEFDALLGKADDLAAKMEQSEQAKARRTALGRLDATDDTGFRQIDVLTAEAKGGFVNAMRTKTAYATKVGQTEFKAAIPSGGTLPTAGALASPSSPGTGVWALRNLLFPQDAEGPTVRYYRMGTATAAVVAEGAQKPDSGATVTPVDTSLIKIASVTRLTNELVDDAPALVDAITREVVMGTLRKENAEIVTALSGASGVMAATGTLATALDVLAAAIGSTEALNGVTPSAVLVNPGNLATIRQAKASTGGSYFIDPLGSGPTTIHGVPVISTAAVAAGTALLVSAGAGVFYTRSEIKVDLGLSGTDFEFNTMTLRVEERVLPAVVRPALITKVTLT